jgi:hypothetical protein
MTEGEMKRRIHTTIATLLAVVCVSAVVAPMASAAPPKPQGPSKAQMCATLKLMYEYARDEALAAAKSGDKGRFDTMSDAAFAYYANADSLGCRWARALVVVPQSDFGPTVDPVVLDVR